MVGRLISGGAALALAFATCGPAAALTDPSPLASRSTTGGLCRAGPCASRLVIRTNGAWTMTSTGATAAREAGTLTTRQLRQLRAAVAGTRLSSSTPFTGTCPTAYDGTEVTYGWRAGDAWRHVSSCERVIPPADPLVRFLAGIAGDLG